MPPPLHLSLRPPRPLPPPRRRGSHFPFVASRPIAARLVSLRRGGPLPPCAAQGEAEPEGGAWPDGSEEELRRLLEVLPGELRRRVETHPELPALVEEAVFSSFGKACLFSSCIIYVLPPACLAEPCEQEYSLPNMPLLFAIAMVGATVGGLLARQRRGELARLNDQLRQINVALRRQAKIESYAPALSYAPVGSKISDSEVIVDPQKERLIAYLRTGKNYLRNQTPDKAFPEFKAAIDLAQALGDHVEEKKAARGLGASLQRQGKYKEAIKYHSMVLNISKMTGEDAGVTEAYGAIADCYTELGELEKAGKFYDKYIARLEND